jgi:hypothetical protein
MKCSAELMMISLVKHSKTPVGGNLSTDHQAFGWNGFTLFYFSTKLTFLRMKCSAELMMISLVKHSKTPVGGNLSTTPPGVPLERV